MLTINDNGVVLFEDTASNFQATIGPGDTELAELLLSVDDLAAVQAAWTPAVVDAWLASLPAPVEPGPALPTQEQRLVAVEDAVLELMLGGLF